jgi:hypothetical protein
MPRRQSKIFPPGTFIPTSARVCAILQLCVAFSALLWNLSQPFAGELFRQKSRVLLYEEIIGHSSSTIFSQERFERLERNKIWFEKLPEKRKINLLQGYQNTKKEIQQPFIDKAALALKLLLFDLPVFEQAWILFSILLAILLLKRVEGAHLAIWLLPLIAICYCIDNRLSGRTSSNEESSLFPSEKKIVQEYVKTTLSRNIFEQEKQLKEGWNLYLVREWLKQSPSKDPSAFKMQIEEAEFAFTIARIEKRLLDEQQEKRFFFPKKHSFILACYLFWNLFFAYIAWKVITAANKLQSLQHNQPMLEG